METSIISPSTLLLKNRILGVVRVGRILKFRTKQLVVPEVFDFSGALRAGWRFRRDQDCEQQELQRLEQEMEVVAGGREHGLDGIAGRYAR